MALFTRKRTDNTVSTKSSGNVTRSDEPNNDDRQSFAFENTIKDISVAEQLEESLSTPIETLAENWNAAYEAFEIGNSDMQEVWKQFLGKVALDHNQTPPEPGMLYSHRAARRIDTKYGKSQGRLSVTEAWMSARIYARGLVEGDTTLARQADIFSVPNPFAIAESVSFDSQETYLAASQLHSELTEYFVEIEKNSKVVINTIQEALKQGPESRSSVVDWISSKDQQLPEDRILLKTIGANFIENKQAYEDIFINFDEISPFIAEVMLSLDIGTSNHIQEFVSFGKNLLRENGIKIHESDAEFIMENYNELPTAIQEQIIDFSKKFGADLFLEFNRLISPYSKDKRHINPTIDELRSVMARQHMDDYLQQQSHSPKKRKNKGNNGRTTKPSADRLIINPGESEQKKGLNLPSRLVPSDDTRQAKWKLESLPENIDDLAESLITQMSERKTVESDSDLYDDISTAIDALIDNPMTRGSKKTNSPKQTVFIQGERRTLPRRSFNPGLNPQLDAKSIRNNDIRIVYYLYGNNVIIDKIFLNHDEYERHLDS